MNRFLDFYYFEFQNFKQEILEEMIFTTLLFSIYAMRIQPFGMR